MSKYIKLFDTHTEYETYIGGNDKFLPVVIVKYVIGVCQFVLLLMEIHYNINEQSVLKGCSFSFMNMFLSFGAIST